MVHLEITPVVGLPQFNGWSQVSTNNFDSQYRLVCAFSIFGDQAGNVGREVSVRVQEAQLMTSLAFYSFLEEIITFVTQAHCQINIAAALFLHDKQTAFAVHGANVFLKREKKAGIILQSEQELKLISGKHQPEDIVVLSTGQARVFIEEIEQKLLQGIDVDTIVTTLVPGLHNLSDSSLSSFAFIVESSHQPTLTKNDVFFEATLDTDATDIGVELALEEPQLMSEDLTSSVIVSKKRPATHAVSRLKTSVAAGLTSGSKTFVISAKKIIEKIKKIPALFAQLKNRTPFSSDVYLKPSISKKIVRLVLVLGLVVAIISASLYAWFRYQNNQEAAAQTIVQPFKEKLEIIRQKSEQDPLIARTEVKELVESLEQAQHNYENQKKTSQYLEEQLRLARELYDQISGQEELQELTVFYDLRSVQSDFVATLADIYSLGHGDGTYGVFVDKDKKSVIILYLEKKEPKIIEITDREKLQAISAGSTVFFLLGQGISSYEYRAEGVPVTIKEEGDSNRNATYIENYNGYIYILNSEKRNIYRYAPQDDGEYSEPIGWLKSPQGIPFEEVSSFAIDGDVWLTSTSSVIERLSGGRKQEFVSSGLPTPFESSLKLYTDEATENLYVLEASKQRVVILKKTGEFVREIKSPSLAAATTILYSSDLKKILVVSGSIVYEIIE